MFNRRKLIYTFLLLAIFLALTPSRVLACDGITPSFWDAFTSATAVFTGKVMQIETDGDLIVTFQVLKAWKGPPDEKLIVTTAGNPISCGIPFGESESDTFLVYAYDGANQLSTHKFSRTMPLSEAGADTIKLSVITNPVLITLIIVAIGLVIMYIGRHFFLKGHNRSLSEHEDSEIQSSATR